MRVTTHRRCKRFCSIAVLCVSFTWQMVKTRVIRLRGAEGRDARDQTAFRAFHSFLVEVRMLATYMRLMRTKNLKIKIASSSCRPQLQKSSKRIQCSNELMFHCHAIVGGSLWTAALSHQKKTEKGRFFLRGGGGCTVFWQSPVKVACRKV